MQASKQANNAMALQQAQMQQGLLYAAGSTATGGTTSTNSYAVITLTGTSATTGSYATTWSDDYGGVSVQDARIIGHRRVNDGDEAHISLPDGSIIHVDKDGSFTIDDSKSKVIYRANRMRDFNAFINVSDRLEEFIAFCGQHGVRRGEMMELPLHLFIGWLVIQAAKADKEPEPDIKLLPDLRKRVTPRCPSCGRFTLAEMRARRIEFCAPACFDRHYNRHIALAAP